MKTSTHFIMFVWVPLAIASTIIALLVYAGIQQSIRQAANDPQIEIARNIADQLGKGQPAYAPFGLTQVDIAHSLSAFDIIYDRNGRVLASSGFLNGEMPVLPQGVFEYTKANQEDVITWEPAPGVRIASVIRWFDGKDSGYVLVGRSLFEAEKGTRHIFFITAIGWLGLLIVSGLATFSFYKLFNRLTIKNL